MTETFRSSALALNRSVERILAVLHAFGGERRALTLVEIAAAAAITKSAAQRITNTLQHLGYLRRDKRVQRWILSARVLTIGHAYCPDTG